MTNLKDCDIPSLSCVKDSNKPILCLVNGSDDCVSGRSECDCD